MYKSLRGLDSARIRTLIEDLTQSELEDRVDFLPSLLPRGKVGGLQIPRWQGFAVDYYGCTLAVLTLEPSDFCNNGVTFFTNCLVGATQPLTPDHFADIRDPGRIQIPILYSVPQEPSSYLLSIQKY